MLAAWSQEPQTKTIEAEGDKPSAVFDGLPAEALLGKNGQQPTIKATVTIVAIGSAESKTMSGNAQRFELRSIPLRHEVGAEGDKTPKVDTPAAPKVVNVKGGGAIDVSWQEPVARLCKIVRYHIEMQDAAEEEAETVKKTIEGQTTCRFEELRRGQRAKCACKRRRRQSRNQPRQRRGPGEAHSVRCRT